MTIDSLLSDWRPILSVYLMKQTFTVVTILALCKTLKSNVGVLCTMFVLPFGSLWFLYFAETQIQYFFLPQTSNSDSQFKSWTTSGANTDLIDIYYLLLFCPPDWTVESTQTSFEPNIEQRIVSYSPINHKNLN